MYVKMARNMFLGRKLSSSSTTKFNPPIHQHDLPSFHTVLYLTDQFNKFHCGFMFVCTSVSFACLLTYLLTCTMYPGIYRMWQNEIFPWKFPSTYI